MESLLLLVVMGIVNASVDGIPWLGYVGLLISIAGGSLMVRSIGMGRPRSRHALALLILAVGSACALSAVEAGQWWMLILTLHIAVLGVFLGYGVAYHRLNQTGPYSSAR